MRKTITMFTLAFICSVAFVSCKKEYTCTCTATVDVPFFGQLSTTEAKSLGKTTKKKAEKSCDEAETALQNELGSEGTASCKYNILLLNLIHYSPACEQGAVFPF